MWRAEGDSKLKRRVYFDVTGLVQWYAYVRNPSGIQRVMESILGQPGLANHSDVEFITRALGSDRFYKVDPNCISGLRDPALRHISIASLRRVFADSMRAGQFWRLWNEMLGDHLAYVAIGWARASRPWEAINLGYWPPKPSPMDAATPPTSRDLIVVLGDFWCLKGHVEALVQQKSNTGVGIMVMIHDLFAVYHPNWTHPYYGREFVTQLGALADHVDHWLTNSNYVKKQLTQFLTERGLPTTAIAVLPMGWPESVPRWSKTIDDAYVLQKYGLERDSYFLCVGTIEPRKNFASLMEATLQLNFGTTKSRAICVFVGRAGWRSAGLIKRLRTLENAHRCVRWINNADDAELASLYRNAKFTIVPSHNEGWGLVVQESLAHGVPCVAAAVGGVLEAGRGLATYVDPHDPSKFFKTIHDYASDERILARARHRIEDRLKAGPMLPKWSHSVEFLFKLTGLNPRPSYLLNEFAPQSAEAKPRTSRGLPGLSSASTPRMPNTVAARRRPRET